MNLIPHHQSSCNLPVIALLFSAPFEKHFLLFVTLYAFPWLHIYSLSLHIDTFVESQNCIVVEVTIHLVGQRIK